MSPNDFEIAIIGGGVVGSALARVLGLRFDRVLLIEKERAVGLHTSGRNSGVIHSGFNIKPGTLKARLCVEGSRRLREYCKENGVPHEVVGTFVVAGEPGDDVRLEALKKRGEANGVPGLEIISGEELRRREPQALGDGALFSPTGAIVDSTALTGSLARQAQDANVRIALTEEITGLEERTEDVLLTTPQGRYAARLVINCAGLHSDRLAHRMGVGRAYTVLPFRGEYFAVKRVGPPIIHSMLYHVPNPLFPFLGIHVTKTIQGPVLLGPNAVPAFGRESYSPTQFNARDIMEMFSHRGSWRALFNVQLLKLGWAELRHSYNRSHFWREASKLVKGLRLDEISAERRVGIRPQLVNRSGELVEDLVIETTPRSVHILNVVSPGMTSALAFADWIAGQISDAATWTGSAQAMVR